LKLLGGYALRLRDDNIAASMELLGVQAAESPPG
jgi:hypothetical protein